MRISELAGLTSLPLDQLGAEVVGGDVVAALPVDVDQPDRGSVLVATKQRLGVVGHHRDNLREGLVTLWAPWDMVSLETNGLERSTRSGDPTSSRLVVRVGNRRFAAVLEGAAGRAAVDDFARAVMAPQKTRHDSTPPRGPSLASGTTRGEDQDLDGDGVRAASSDPRRV